VITPDGLFVGAGLGDGDAVDDGNGVGGVGDVFEPEFVHPRANTVEAPSRKNKRRHIGKQGVLRTAYLWDDGCSCTEVNDIGRARVWGCTLLAPAAQEVGDHPIRAARSSPYASFVCGSRMQARLHERFFRVPDQRAMRA
jgi:hypothetical protein